MERALTTTAKRPRQHNDNAELTIEQDVAILRAVTALQPQHTAPSNAKRRWQQVAERVMTATGADLTGERCRQQFELLVANARAMDTSAWPADEELRELLEAALSEHNATASNDVEDNHKPPPGQQVAARNTSALTHVQALARRVAHAVNWSLWSQNNQDTGELSTDPSITILTTSSAERPPQTPIPIEIDACDRGEAATPRSLRTKHRSLREESEFQPVLNRLTALETSQVDRNQELQRAMEAQRLENTDSHYQIQELQQSVASLKTSLALAQQQEAQHHSMIAMLTSRLNASDRVMDEHKREVASLTTKLHEIHATQETHAMELTRIKTMRQEQAQARAEQKENVLASRQTPSPQEDTKLMFASRREPFSVVQPPQSNEIVLVDDDDTESE